MREENEAIEKEMATDEYKQKAREMFAKLRAIGKKGGKKWKSPEDGLNLSHQERE